MKSLSFLMLFPLLVCGQGMPQRLAPTPGPMLSDGTIAVDAPAFRLKLVKSSQTVAALEPKALPGFDFTPGDLLTQRSQNGYYHLGDIDLRLRKGKSGAWSDYSTALSRTAVTALPISSSVLAAADLTPTLPADIPVKIVRQWASDNGALVLRFEITNTSKDEVEIGALGIPMIFNNVLTGKSLDQAHKICSFYDPYIGEDAGYLQVTRLSGAGPVLIVTPDGKTPFEAYNPIHQTPGGRGGPVPKIFTDPTQQTTTFEGFYDWMVHSRAYAENEWKAVKPWNPATSMTLAPGKSRTYGVRFLLSDTIRGIERTLMANKRPVAVGIPGYIVPMDIDAKLFLNYDKRVKSIAPEPSGALQVVAGKKTPNGWAEYTVHGKQWGRSRLTVTYEDGTEQTIQYFVTKPEPQVVADMGHFLTTKQWFVDDKDPFHRSPSIMTYDREENQFVTQDPRVWIAGLGDEGGSIWLSEALKLFGEPDKREIDQYQQFIDKVLWGGLQISEGARQYAVRKSLFYYAPDQMPPNYYRKDINWSTWTSWNLTTGFNAVDRSYDYPHVAALHWTMYRLARNTTGLVTNHPWDWYLNNAYQTAIAMTKFAPQYARYGQMEGTIFLEILKDLQREGWKQQADTMEAAMKKRTEEWTRLAYPFGSEMPWDSTGQEEVYDWTKYFGDKAKAQVTLDVILAYMPAIPHWGYNGSARRYWDFVYAGKLRRIERQLHHYGSGLNAIPVLSEFRDHPDDLYLLRIGYAGTMGALANIDQEGFAAPAFHSFPDTLKVDGISGDAAQNFFGHAENTATYVVNDGEFGWQSFGGNTLATAAKVTVTPLDSFRSRVYLAPYGLWLTLDAGKFDKIEVNPKTGAVRVGLAAQNSYTPAARLRIEQPAPSRSSGKYAPSGSLKQERGAYVVPLQSATTWVELKP